MPLLLYCHVNIYLLASRMDGGDLLYIEHTKYVVLFDHNMNDGSTVRSDTVTLTIIKELLALAAVDIAFTTTLFRPSQERMDSTPLRYTFDKDSLGAVKRLQGPILYTELEYSAG